MVIRWWALLVLLFVLLVLPGCYYHLGTVRPEPPGAPGGGGTGVRVATEGAAAGPARACAGVMGGFGDVEAPCGYAGGTISAPGAGLIKGVAEIVGRIFGAGSGPPVTIQVSGEGVSADVVE